jgi:putative ABC transport system permease protein
METFFERVERDVRYALRQLWAARGLSLLAIFTLALGIGSNAALFTVVYDVMLRPLPYTDAGLLQSIDPRTNPPTLGQTSWLNYQDLKRSSRTFSAMGSYAIDFAVVQDGAGAQSVAAPKLTVNLLPMLGVHPILGRLFDTNEGVPGGPQAVLLSETLWRSAFHADPGVIGKTVKVSGVERTVVGVMPESFRFPDELGSNIENAVWLPLQPSQEMLTGRGYNFLNIIGLRQPDVSVAQSQDEIDALTRRIRQNYSDAAKNLAFTVTPYQTLVTGQVSSALNALTAALGLVLLIACANVANILVARFLGRRQEFAVRVALGAGRSRLVWQLLTEGALLSLAGCLCGLGLAAGALALVNKLPKDTLPIAGPVTMHWPVLVALAAVATLTTVLSSLLPAMLAARTDPQTALQGASRALGSGTGGSRISKWLVVGEVTLSSLLLMGTGLLFHTLWNLEHTSLGFDTTHVTTFTAVPPNSQGFSGAAVPGSVSIAPPATATQSYTALLERMRNAPGVEDAALMSMPPFSGIHFGADGIEIVGRPKSETKRISTLLSAVSPGYTRTMGIPMLRGRMIDEQDVAGAPKVAVISQTFARRFFPGVDPLQHQLVVGGKDTGMVEPYTIVGVIPDQPDQNLNDAPVPLLLLPYQQIPTTSLFYGMMLESLESFVVKTHGDIPVANEMRGLFRQYAPGYALDNFATMEQTVHDSMTAWQRNG